MSKLLIIVFLLLSLGCANNGNEDNQSGSSETCYQIVEKHYDLGNKSEYYVFGGCL